MQNVAVISYEFTYSPFSGNGVLARSVVKSLLMHNCRSTVFCCRPAHVNGTTSPDLPLQPPEISPEQHERLALYPVTLSKESGWQKLDEGAAWQAFDWKNLDAHQQQGLAAALTQAKAVIVVDWTGACAWRSLTTAVFETSARPPMIYLNFRVYSSGVADHAKHEWYDRMERLGLDDAAVVVALSQKDKDSLKTLMTENNRDIHILVPPLRGDVQQLAGLSAEELRSDLPSEVAATITKRSPEERCFVTCVARLGREKQVMRFVRFVEATKSLWQDDHHGFIPLLAGASSDLEYAQDVKEQLVRAQPNSTIIDHFLSPRALAAVFSRTILNFHPCGYEAFGMTIVEAGAFGAPSVIASNGHVGASAIVGNGASIQVDMSQPEMLSQQSVQEILGAVKDLERLKSVGKLARERALAWDEDAYGRALLELIPA